MPSQNEEVERFREVALNLGAMNQNMPAPEFREWQAKMLDHMQEVFKKKAQEDAQAMYEKKLLSDALSSKKKMTKADEQAVVNQYLGVSQLASEIKLPNLEIASNEINKHRTRFSCARRDRDAQFKNPQKAKQLYVDMNLVVKFNALQEDWPAHIKSAALHVRLKHLIKCAQAELRSKEGLKPHYEIFEVLCASQDKHHRMNYQSSTTAEHIEGMFKLFLDLESLAVCGVCCGFGHNELICPAKRAADIWSSNQGCNKLWDSIKSLFWWQVVRQEYNHLSDYSDLYKTDFWLRMWIDLDFD